MNLKLIRNLVLSGLLGVAAVYVSQSGPAEAVDHVIWDGHQGAKLGASQTKIAVVVIDEETAKKWNEPMSLWGPRYARVISNIAAQKPKWIGVDIFFALDVDRYLDGDGVKKKFDEPLAKVLQEVSGLTTLLVADEAKELDTKTSYSKYAMLANNTASAGLIPDSDGIVRRAKLAYGSNYAFATAIAARVKGIGPADDGSIDPLPIRAMAGVESEDTTFGISFFDNIKVFDAATIESMASDEQDEFLKDAVVLFGANHSSQPDAKKVPGSRGMMSGVELHANILATLLQNRAIRFPEQRYVVGLASLLGFVSALVALAGHPYASAVWLIILAVGGLAVNNRILTEERLFWPIGCLIVAAVVTGSTARFIRLLDEWQSRAKIQAVFGKFVSEEVSNYVLANPANMNLGGQEMEGTVVFVDLWNSVERGYSRTPTILITELNEMFERIVPTVKNNGGLINRFTGDGFLALFGVPLPIGNHADAAVKCCKEMQTALDELNSSRQGDPLIVSCGIHSGRFVCGNIGSKQRAEFTVIGDVVNAAARIESANRTVGTRVLMSEATYKLLSKPPKGADHYTVAAKGRANIDVYSLNSDSKNDKGDSKNES